MANYNEVLKNIDTLEEMLPGLFSFSKPNWKAIWGQIRTTGQSFKGSRFPSKDEHHAAWDRFQGLVEQAKDAQKESQREWENKKAHSSELKDQIIRLAAQAHPFDVGLANVIVGLATGGISFALDAIMGPFDEQKEMLISCSNKLKEGFTVLSQNKEHMLGYDKALAYEALHTAQEKLDHAWDNYKTARQQAWDEYQEERSAKHDAFVNRVQANIDNLEERREKLQGVLAHKERHLEDLYDKLADARGDDYRDRISVWIEEERDSISDIRDKLSDIEAWIEEHREKLR